MLKQLSYQDRLGTNVGKAEKTAFSRKCMQESRSGAKIRHVRGHAGAGRLRCAIFRRRPVARPITGTPWLLADCLLGNQFPIHIERSNRGFPTWFPSLVSWETGSPSLLYRFPNLVSWETSFPSLYGSPRSRFSSFRRWGCGGHISRGVPA